MLTTVATSGPTCFLTYLSINLNGFNELFLPSLLPILP